MKHAEHEQKTILLVEDEPSAREACVLYLRAKGYNVLAAAGADAATHIISQHSIDLLITDWQLHGGEDGLSIVRRLRESSNVPVVLMSAYPIDELKRASDGLLVNQFMSKPLSLTNLSAAAEALLAP